MRDGFGSGAPCSCSRAKDRTQGAARDPAGGGVVYREAFRFADTFRDRKGLKILPGSQARKGTSIQTDWKGLSFPDGWVWILFRKYFPVGNFSDVPPSPPPARFGIFVTKIPVAVVKASLGPVTLE